MGWRRGWRSAWPCHRAGRRCPGGAVVPREVAAAAVRVVPPAAAVAHAVGGVNSWAGGGKGGRATGEGVREQRAEGGGRRRPWCMMALASHSLSLRCFSCGISFHTYVSPSANSSIGTPMTHVNNNGDCPQSGLVDHPIPERGRVSVAWGGRGGWAGPGGSGPRDVSKDCASGYPP